MRRLVIIQVSVDYPEYLDVHDVEDHMLMHDGITRFFIDEYKHKVVLVYDRKKTNWAKAKHEMEDEGLRVLGSSITGVA